MQTTNEYRSDIHKRHCTLGKSVVSTMNIVWKCHACRSKEKAKPNYRKTKPYVATIPVIHNYQEFVPNHPCTYTSSLALTLPRCLVWVSTVWDMKLVAKILVVPSSSGSLFRDFFNDFLECIFCFLLVSYSFLGTSHTRLNFWKLLVC